MSYFHSKSYNCTAAQLLNLLRTHFKEFQSLSFSTSSNVVKMRFQPEKHFSLKMKIFKSSNFFLTSSILISSHPPKHDSFSFGNVF